MRQSTPKHAPPALKPLVSYRDLDKGTHLDSSPHSVVRDPDMVKLYTPIPLQYGVIHIDPIATVERFPYPDIIQAAKEMTPKKYLVFVRKDVGLPWPNRPWYLFDVIPIAPCEPPDDGTMTPEMCVPIFPNTRHPNGRMHIHTTPEFPYNNCYHWPLAEKLTVRIRAKPEKFDDDHAIKLEPRELITLWDLAAPDHFSERPDEDSLSGDGSTSLQSNATARGDSPSAGEHQQHALQDRKPHRVPTASENQVGESIQPAASGAERDSEAADSASIRSRRSVESEHSANSEFRAIMGTGIFGNTNQDKELFPLVDLWLELVDHLRQDDIPNPGDLYKEYEAVVRLATEAKRRWEQEERLAALKRQVDETGGDVDDLPDEPVALEKESFWQIKHKRCRPKEVIRRLRSRVVRMLSGIKHALRLPYVPIWS